MKVSKTLMFLFILFLSVNSSFADQSMSDFSLKLYKQDILHEWPYNSLEQCNSKLDYNNSTAKNIYDSRSSCFQLYINKKYFYFICRNTKVCNKTSILKSIDYEELPSSVSSWTDINLSVQNLDDSTKNCSNEVNLDSYKKINSTTKNKIITLVDKLHLKFQDKNKLIQSIELWYFDYRLLLTKNKLDNSSSKEVILEVIDLLSSLLTCKIDSLWVEVSDLKNSDSVDSFLWDIFGEDLWLDWNDSNLLEETKKYILNRVSWSKTFSDYIWNYNWFDESVLFVLSDLLYKTNVINSDDIDSSSSSLVDSSWTSSSSNSNSNSDDISSNSNDSETEISNEFDLKTFNNPIYKWYPLWIGRDVYWLQWCKDNFNKNSNFVYRATSSHNDGKPFYYYTIDEWYVFSESSWLWSVIINIVCWVWVSEEKSKELSEYYNKNRYTTIWTFDEEKIKKILKWGLLSFWEDQALNFCRDNWYENLITQEEINWGFDRYYVYSWWKTEKLSANCNDFKCTNFIVCWKSSQYATFSNWMSFVWKLMWDTRDNVWVSYEEAKEQCEKAWKRLPTKEEVETHINIFWNYLVTKLGLRTKEWFLYKDENWWDRGWTWDDKWRRALYWVEWWSWRFETTWWEVKIYDWSSFENDTKKFVRRCVKDDNFEGIKYENIEKKYDSFVEELPSTWSWVWWSNPAWYVNTDCKVTYSAPWTQFSFIEKNISNWWSETIYIDSQKANVRYTCNNWSYSSVVLSCASGYSLSAWRCIKNSEPVNIPSNYSSSNTSSSNSSNITPSSCWILPDPFCR